MDAYKYQQIMCIWDTGIPTYTQANEFCVGMTERLFGEMADYWLGKALRYCWLSNGRSSVAHWRYPLVLGQDE